MSNEKSEQKIPGISIPSELEAIYSNLARITHSPSEFIFDFAQMLPGMKGPLIKTRVLLSPLSTKLIYKALGDNLAKYESIYGEITLPGKASLADSLFTPPDQPDT